MVVGLKPKPRPAGWESLQDPRLSGGCPACGSQNYMQTISSAKPGMHYLSCNDCGHHWERWTGAEEEAGPNPEATASPPVQLLQELLDIERKLHAHWEQVAGEQRRLRQEAELDRDEWERRSHEQFGLREQAELRATNAERELADLHRDRNREHIRRLEAESIIDAMRRLLERRTHVPACKEPCATGNCCRPASVAHVGDAQGSDPDWPTGMVQAGGEGALR